MTVYKYIAVDQYGKRVEGKLEAENERDLESRLANMGYFLLAASEELQGREVYEAQVIDPREVYTEDKETHYHIHYHVESPNMQELHQPEQKGSSFFSGLAAGGLL